MLLLYVLFFCFCMSEVIPSFRSLMFVKIILAVCIMMGMVV